MKKEGKSTSKSKRKRIWPQAAHYRTFLDVGGTATEWRFRRVASQFLEMREKAWRSGKSALEIWPAFVEWMAVKAPDIDPVLVYRAIDEVFLYYEKKIEERYQRHMRQWMATRYPAFQKLGGTLSQSEFERAGLKKFEFLHDFYARGKGAHAAGKAFDAWMAVNAPGTKPALVRWALGGKRRKKRKKTS